MQLKRNFVFAVFLLAAVALLTAGSACTNQSVDNTPPEPTPPPVNEISSFDDCVQAGNEVLESFPLQCRTEDGRVFTEEIADEDMPPPPPMEELEEALNNMPPPPPLPPAPGEDVIEEELEDVVEE